MQNFCCTPLNGIENQIGKSNDDQLGKLITYSSALEARVAVWIVSEPRPEHTKAITWLNESRLNCMRWLAELDLLMAVDGYPSIADLRALRALNACDVSYWHETAKVGRAEHVRSARVIQTSTCSAMARASSTSMPRYLMVLSILVWPSRSCTALRLPVRR